MEIFLLTFMTLVPLIVQIDPFQGLENAIAIGIGAFSLHFIGSFDLRIQENRS